MKLKLMTSDLFDLAYPKGGCEHFLEENDAFIININDMFFISKVVTGRLKILKEFESIEEITISSFYGMGSKEIHYLLFFLKHALKIDVETISKKERIFFKQFEKDNVSRTIRAVKNRKIQFLPASQKLISVFQKNINNAFPVLNLYLESDC